MINARIHRAYYPDLCLAVCDFLPDPPMLRIRLSPTHPQYHHVKPTLSRRAYLTCQAESVESGQRAIMVLKSLHPALQGSGHQLPRKVNGQF
jgi:hypothetical protein